MVINNRVNSMRIPTAMSRGIASRAQKYKIKCKQPFNLPKNTLKLLKNSRILTKSNKIARLIDTFSGAKSKYTDSKANGKSTRLSMMKRSEYDSYQRRRSAVVKKMACTK